MIFKVGSEVVAHHPGSIDDSDVEEIKDENVSLNERTPHQKNVQNKANTGEGPYETPVVLRTMPWAPSVVQDDDTEADDSETERDVTTKKATRVSSGDRDNLNVDID